MMFGLDKAAIKRIQFLFRFLKNGYNNQISSNKVAISKIQFEKTQDNSKVVI